MSRAFYRLLLSCALTVMALQPTRAQEALWLINLSDAERFAQTYYQHPQPEAVEDFIRVFQSEHVADRPGAGPSYVGFFSELFLMNPDRMHDWEAVISKQHGQTRTVLEQSIAVAKTGGMTALPHQAAIDVAKADGVPTIGQAAAENDMYWGAFFASGRAEYLQRLVDQLHYCDERDDQMLFVAGVTAKWSLASNAQHHQLVHDTLAGRALVADQRTRALIDELLAEGPQMVKQEVAAALREQHAAGKWLSPK
jgi:hypothetical protein